VAVLDDLKEYLGRNADRHADPVLLSVIEVETAAQARKCRLPVDEDGVALPPTGYDADLYEALLRRCQRNLALRSLPLGLTDVSDTSEGGRSYIPSRDVEITRLEGPFRKWVVG
jgi:hypothetical protein